MSLTLDGRPPGLQMALHHCDVKLCVNPQHLYVGTAQDNMEDRADRNPGSWPTGENNPAHKLTDRERAEVRSRRAAGETLRAIGRDYGISHTAVRLTCL